MITLGFFSLQTAKSETKKNQSNPKSNSFNEPSSRMIVDNQVLSKLKTLILSKGAAAIRAAQLWQHTAPALKDGGFGNLGKQAHTQQKPAVLESALIPKTSRESGKKTQRLSCPNPSFTLPPQGRQCSKHSEYFL